MVKENIIGNLINNFNREKKRTVKSLEEKVWDRNNIPPDAHRKYRQETKEVVYTNGGLMISTQLWKLVDEEVQTLHTNIVIDKPPEALDSDELMANLDAAIEEVTSDGPVAIPPEVIEQTLHPKQASFEELFNE